MKIFGDLWCGASLIMVVLAVIGAIAMPFVMIGVGISALNDPRLGRDADFLTYIFMMGFGGLAALIYCVCDYIMKKNKDAGK